MVWEKGEALIVPDVVAFPGHIACNAASRSELVLPLFKDGICIGVLDIDSDRLNTFDSVDQTYLQRILNLLKL